EEVVLYTMDGRVADRQQMTGEGTLDISKLARGVYIVRCGARTTKLVVR
ncbi:MAG: T9SS type A sorting domain-containing protein, partial [Bacteroidales bacterium]|nr:T9SS type A sorting domain-containing protein [Bacteroidales bacterium]